MLQALSRAGLALREFLDLRALALIAIAAAISFVLDPPLARTIFIWSAPFLLFAGIAVIVSKHVLPQISLGEHVEQARLGNVGSGLVVLGICVMLGCLFIALGIWGSPR